MLLESRKLRVIEKVLQVNNESALTALEALLSKLKAPFHSNSEKELHLKSFSGVWTEDEAGEISKAIEQGCENEVDNLLTDEWL